MVEGSPEELQRSYSAINLEDVFIKVTQNEKP
jgi:hypothetical protein